MSDDDRDDLLGDAAGEHRRGRDDDLGNDFESGGGSKKLLLILLPILLLGGGGAGVYFSGILGTIARETDQARAVVEPRPQKSIFFDLPDMLVNINSVGPRPSFLKLRASLELAEGADTILLTILKPRIIDKFQVYLRELRREDLKGSAGIFRLKEELLLRVNVALHPAHINDVLFKELLVQ